METLCSIGHARGFLWGGRGGGAGAGVGLPFQRARGVCVLPLLIPVSRETGARQTRDWERVERETERYCTASAAPRVVFAVRGQLLWHNEVLLHYALQCFMVSLDFYIARCNVLVKIFAAC